MVSKRKVKKSNSRVIFLSFVWIIALILLFMIIFPLLKFVWGLVGYHIDYSEGVRVGQVVKLSEKGYIWKTYEADLGVTQSGAYLYSWSFSVDRDNPNKEEIIDFLTQAYNQGYLVRIQYTQKAGTLPWHGDTTYFVKQVDLLIPEGK